MQRVVSFNVCATFILFALLISLISGKMIKGTENKSFLWIVILTFISSVSDILRNIIPVANKPYLVFVTYFFTYVYFGSRMLISSAYLWYILGLTRLIYRINKQKVYYYLLHFIPFCIFLVLIINFFVPVIFYFDEYSLYHRGKLIIISYLFSFLPMFVSLLLFIKEKDVFSRIDFFINFVIFPCVILGIVLQIFYPKYLLENITTTFAVFLISIIVHRPEEKLNISTQSLGYNAYVQEINRNLSVGIPLILVFIHIDNYKQIKRKFSTKNYNEFLKDVIQKISQRGDCQSEIYYLDNCNFVLTYINKDISNVLCACECILDYLLHLDYQNIQIKTENTLCVVKCPDEMNDIDKILSFSNNFYRTIILKNVVTSLEKEKREKDFKIHTELDSIIKKAIKKESFQIYYQPIYNVQKKSFTAAEALIRLPDDEFGLIPPSMFIPASEESGAIHKIGEIVINKVCNFISTHKLERMGLDYIEINLSVSQCLQEHFAEDFIDTLEKHGIDKTKINLEITETATNNDKGTTNKNITQLAHYGLTFSLDDYGTGYSNIRRVTTMPLSIIKLDKTFVDEYKKDKMNIVIKQTIDMFKKMNKYILVEGIEHKEALDYFISLGCDYVQGFYFSKPIPERDFVKFIRDANRKSRGQNV